MRRRLGGFGLVELLVSMALGLLLTMALMQTLLGSRDSLLLLRHGNQLQEDARYLMGRLATDLRAAGSEGCLDLQLGSGLALPEPLAQPVSYQGGVLQIVTALPVRVQADAATTYSPGTFGARWLVAGNCRDRVSITEDALQLQPGDWLLALRQLEYRQQDDRVQVRLNGSGNFETLIEQVVDFRVQFALAIDAALPDAGGRYQPTLTPGEQPRLRSVRVSLALSDNPGSPQAGRLLTQHFTQVTRLRNRPDQ